MSERLFWKLGWPLLIVLALIPIGIWVTLIPLSSRVGNAYVSLTSLGRFTGIVAIVLFCFNMILATRLKFIESLFGGLNKMFIAHHLIGGLALCFALLHSLSLTLRLTTVSLRDAATFALPGTTDLPTTLGIVGLWGFVVLMIVTFYIKLPYRIWLFTHKFLGAVFLLIAGHVVFISGDINRSRFLKIYLVVLMIAALASFVYRTILPRFVVRRYQYQIAQVQQVSKGVVRISMMPTGRPLDFIPGQFIFVSFRIPGFSHEWHPFSISSNSSESGLSITVKNLGSYTDSLIKLSPGMVGTTVWVEGAYGRFSFRNFPAKRQIWIAGGIGITPFLSMMPDIKPDYKVDLYYSVKSPDELIDEPRINDWINASNGALRIIPIVADRDGMLTAQKIAATSGDLSTSEILLCGPPGMMRALRTQFHKMGIRSSRIHSEEFAMQ